MEHLIKTGRLVTVFGGSGFVGTHVVQALAQRGWRVRVAGRRPERGYHLQPLGEVGQIQVVQANVRFPESLAAALAESDAVVNLVGILDAQGRQSFDAVNAEGAGAIAEAAAIAGIGALVHLSALGADAQALSHYSRSKAAGEALVRQHFPEAFILRPSVIFGPQDDFLNRFASLARSLPVLPLIGGGRTRFDPVFAGDIGEAVAQALDGKGLRGTTYEIGGPQTLSFRELMEFVCAVTGRSRLFVNIPFGAAPLVATMTEAASAISFGKFPRQIVTTRDQVLLLQSDNVVSDEAKAEGRTLRGLGVEADTLAAIAPAYLRRFRKTGQFDRPHAV